MTEIRNWPELTTLDYNYYVPIQLANGTTKKIKLSTLLGVTPPDTDPLFADVVLLMPLTTAAGLTDIKGKIATNAGTTASTAILDPFGGNTGVRAFTSTNQRISIAQSADFAFGNGAFTIDLWIYPDLTSPGTWGMFDTRLAPQANNWFVSIQPQLPGQTLFYDTVATNFAATPTIPLGQWSYICITRDGISPHKTWVNGVAGSAGANRSSGITANGNLLIGDRVDAVPSSSFQGYLSNLRITRAYRDGSIVPTTPFPTN
jgi:Concanavalin A-like lectin/glucanases superfamily